mgnify:CR=1 FL=1
MQKQEFLRNRRLRVFGGPNGSGKSTILNRIDSKFEIGHYINADEIEKQLKSAQRINLSDYGIHNYSLEKFEKANLNHSLIKKARNDGYKIDLYFENNSIINPDKNSHSYEAAFLADILRNELLSLGKKFAYETVMSHNSKIEFFKKSQQSGYKNYLYYISTESPIINVERVYQRVELGGHPVALKKIESRYYNSLLNLKEAVQNTYRSFIFDNSGSKPSLVLEVYKGEEVTYYNDEIPHWVDKYLL